MTAARKAGDTPPPPWPLSKDPRTDACTHDWDGTWGRVGERQHLCHYCQRWIWEHSIWAERAIGDGQSDDSRPTDTQTIGPDTDRDAPKAH